VPRPPSDRHEPSHQTRWLWRTLRAAGLADLDARKALADAIGERDLAGVRDVAAVIGARLRVPGRVRVSRWYLPKVVVPRFL
jgi:hypothetical protein